METNLKGPCDHCGGLLEFAATDAGAAVECPLCQKTTVLRAPEAAGAGAPRGGRSRRVLLGATAAVLVLSVVGAGAAFYLKQKGGKVAERAEKSGGADRSGGAEKMAKATAPERADDSAAKDVIPVVAPFQAGLSAAQIREGRELFFWKCSECHHLYDVSIYEDRQWDSIFGNMRGKAKLNGAQAQAIGTFVRSIR